MLKDVKKKFILKVFFLFLNNTKDVHIYSFYVSLIRKSLKSNIIMEYGLKATGSPPLV